MQSMYLFSTEPVQTTDQLMESWPDKKLVNWITLNGKGKSDRALAILSERHRRLIYRLCVFRLGNHHDAEDATQDIVMRIHSSLHQYKGEAQFKSWLYSIINNYCNTFAGRRARYVTSDHLQQIIEIHTQDKVLDPHQDMHEQQLIKQTLASLPKHVRRLLKLRFYAEKSLQEMSEILSLSLSATKARLYRAIEEFKRIYLRLDQLLPSI